MCRKARIMRGFGKFEKLHGKQEVSAAGEVRPAVATSWSCKEHGFILSARPIQ